MTLKRKINKPKANLWQDNKNDKVYVALLRKRKEDIFDKW